jgi:WD40 repeat protein
MARELATAAIANLEVDPELSVLLASRAVETTRSSDGTVLPEAEEALHRAVVASRLELEVPGVGGNLAWSPSGVFVTEGPEGSGIIDIRDGETGDSVRSFQGHDGDVTDVAFSADGSRLASTGDDGTLKVWDPSTGRLLLTESKAGSVWAPSFGADGSLVAAGWGNGTVRVVDVSTGRVVATVLKDDVSDAAISPDGKLLAVAFHHFAGADGAVFDVKTHEEAFRLRAPGCCDGISQSAVSWSPDGSYLAAGSEGATHVWDVGRERLIQTLVQNGRVPGLAERTPRLVTAGSDGTAKVWEMGPPARAVVAPGCRDEQLDRGGGLLPMGPA